MDLNDEEGVSNPSDTTDGIPETTSCSIDTETDDVADVNDQSNGGEDNQSQIKVPPKTTTETNDVDDDNQQVIGNNSSEASDLDQTDDTAEESSETIDSSSGNEQLDYIKADIRSALECGQIQIEDKANSDVCSISGKSSPIVDVTRSKHGIESTYLDMVDGLPPSAGKSRSLSTLPSIEEGNEEDSDSSLQLQHTNPSASSSLSSLPSLANLYLGHLVQGVSSKPTLTSITEESSRTNSDEIMEQSGDEITNDNTNVEIIYIASPKYTGSASSGIENVLNGKVDAIVDDKEEILPFVESNKGHGDVPTDDTLLDINSKMIEKQANYQGGEGCLELQDKIKPDFENVPQSDIVVNVLLHEIVDNIPRHENVHEGEIVFDAESKNDGERDKDQKPNAADTAHECGEGNNVEALVCSKVKEETQSNTAQPVDREDHGHETEDSFQHLTCEDEAHLERSAVPTETEGWPDINDVKVEEGEQNNVENKCQTLSESTATSGEEEIDVEEIHNDQQSPVDEMGSANQTGNDKNDQCLGEVKEDTCVEGETVDESCNDAFPVLTIDEKGGEKGTIQQEGEDEKRTTTFSKAKGSGSDSKVNDTTSSACDVSITRESHSEHTMSSANSDKQDKEGNEKDNQKQRDKDKDRDRDGIKRKRERGAEEGSAPVELKECLKNAVGDVCNKLCNNKCLTSGPYMCEIRGSETKTTCRLEWQITDVANDSHNGENQMDRLIQHISETAHQIHNSVHESDSISDSLKQNKPRSKKNKNNQKNKLINIDSTAKPNDPSCPGNTPAPPEAETDSLEICDSSNCVDSSLSEDRISSAEASEHSNQNGPAATSDRVPLLMECDDSGVAAEETSSGNERQEKEKFEECDEMKEVFCESKCPTENGSQSEHETENGSLFETATSNTEFCSAAGHDPEAFETADEISIIEAKSTSKAMSTQNEMYTACHDIINSELTDIGGGILLENGDIINQIEDCLSRETQVEEYTEEKQQQKSDETYFSYPAESPESSNYVTEDGLQKMCATGTDPQEIIGSQTSPSSTVHQCENDRTQSPELTSQWLYEENEHMNVCEGSEQDIYGERKRKLPKDDDPNVCECEQNLSTEEVRQNEYGKGEQNVRVEEKQNVCEELETNICGQDEKDLTENGEYNVFEDGVLKACGEGGQVIGEDGQNKCGEDEQNVRDKCDYLLSEKCEHNSFEEDGENGCEGGEGERCECGVNEDDVSESGTDNEHKQKDGVESGQDKCFEIGEDTGNDEDKRDVCEEQVNVEDDISCGGNGAGVCEKLMETDESDEEMCPKREESVYMECEEENVNEKKEEKMDDKGNDCFYGETTKFTGEKRGDDLCDLGEDDNFIEGNNDVCQKCEDNDWIKDEDDICVENVVCEVEHTIYYKDEKQILCGKGDDNVNEDVQKDVNQEVQSLVCTGHEDNICEKYQEHLCGSNEASHCENDEHGECRAGDDTFCEEDERTECKEVDGGNVYSGSEKKANGDSVCSMHDDNRKRKEDSGKCESNICEESKDNVSVKCEDFEFGQCEDNESGKCDCHVSEDCREMEDNISGRKENNGIGEAKDNVCRESESDVCGNVHVYSKDDACNEGEDIGDAKSEKDNVNVYSTGEDIFSIEHDNDVCKKSDGNESIDKEKMAREICDDKVCGNSVGDNSEDAFGECKDHVCVKDKDESCGELEGVKNVAYTGGFLVRDECDDNKCEEGKGIECREAANKTFGTCGDSILGKHEESNTMEQNEEEDKDLYGHCEVDVYGMGEVDGMGDDAEDGVCGESRDSLCKENDHIHVCGNIVETPIEDDEGECYDEGINSLHGNNEDNLSKEGRDDNSESCDDNACGKIEDNSYGIDVDDLSNKRRESASTEACHIPKENIEDSECGDSECISPINCVNGECMKEKDDNDVQFSENVNDKSDEIEYGEDVKEENVCGGKECNVCGIFEESSCEEGKQGQENVSEESDIKVYGHDKDEKIEGNVCGGDEHKECEQGTAQECGVGVQNECGQFKEKECGFDVALDSNNECGQVENRCDDEGNVCKMVDDNTVDESNDIIFGNTEGNASREGRHNEREEDEDIEHGEGVNNDCGTGEDHVVKEDQNKVCQKDEDIVNKDRETVFGEIEVNECVESGDIVLLEGEDSLSGKEEESELVQGANTVYERDTENICGEREDDICEKDEEKMCKQDRDMICEKCEVNIEENDEGRICKDIEDIVCGKCGDCVSGQCDDKVCKERKGDVRQLEGVEDAVRERDNEEVYDGSKDNVFTEECTSCVEVHRNIYDDNKIKAEDCVCETADGNVCQDAEDGGKNVCEDVERKETENNKCVEAEDSMNKEAEEIIHEESGQNVCEDDLCKEDNACEKAEDNKCAETENSACREDEDILCDEAEDSESRESEDNTCKEVEDSVCREDEGIVCEDVEDVECEEADDNMCGEAEDNESGETENNVCREDEGIVREEAEESDREEAGGNICECREAKYREDEGSEEIEREDDACVEDQGFLSIETTDNVCEKTEGNVFGDLEGLACNKTVEDDACGAGEKVEGIVIEEDKVYEGEVCSEDQTNMYIKDKDTVLQKCKEEDEQTCRKDEDDVSKKGKGNENNVCGGCEHNDCWQKQEIVCGQCEENVCEDFEDIEDNMCGQIDDNVCGEGNENLCGNDEGSVCEQGEEVDFGGLDDDECEDNLCGNGEDYVCEEGKDMHIARENGKYTVFEEGKESVCGKANVCGEQKENVHGNFEGNVCEEVDNKVCKDEDKVCIDGEENECENVHGQIMGDVCDKGEDDESGQAVNNLYGEGQVNECGEVEANVYAAVEEYGSEEGRDSAYEEGEDNVCGTVDDNTCKESEDIARGGSEDKECKGDENIVCEEEDDKIKQKWKGNEDVGVRKDDGTVCGGYEEQVHGESEQNKYALEDDRQRGESKAGNEKVANRLGHEDNLSDKDEVVDGSDGMMISTDEGNSKEKMDLIDKDKNLGVEFDSKIQKDEECEIEMRFGNLLGDAANTCVLKLDKLTEETQNDQDFDSAPGHEGDLEKEKDFEFQRNSQSEIELEPTDNDQDEVYSATHIEKIEIEAQHRSIDNEVDWKCEHEFQEPGIGEEKIVTPEQNIVDDIFVGETAFVETGSGNEGGAINSHRKIPYSVENETNFDEYELVKPDSRHSLKKSQVSENILDSDQEKNHDALAEESEKRDEAEIESEVIKIKEREPMLKMTELNGNIDEPFNNDYDVTCDTKDKGDSEAATGNEFGTVLDRGNSKADKMKEESKLQNVDSRGYYSLMEDKRNETSEAQIEPGSVEMHDVSERVEEDNEAVNEEKELEDEKEAEKEQHNELHLTTDAIEDKFNTALKEKDREEKDNSVSIFQHEDPDVNDLKEIKDVDRVINGENNDLSLESISKKQGGDSLDKVVDKQNVKTVDSCHETKDKINILAVGPGGEKINTNSNKEHAGTSSKKSITEEEEAETEENAAELPENIKHSAIEVVNIDVLDSQGCEEREQNTYDSSEEMNKGTTQDDRHEDTQSETEEHISTQISQPITGQEMVEEQYQCYDDDEEMRKVVCNENVEAKEDDLDIRYEQTVEETKRDDFDIRDEQTGEETKNDDLDIQDEQTGEETKNDDLDIQDEQTGEETKNDDLDIRDEQTGEETKNDDLEIRDEQTGEETKNVDLDIRDEQTGEETKNDDLDIRDEQTGEETKNDDLDIRDEQTVEETKEDDLDIRYEQTVGDTKEDDKDIQDEQTVEETKDDDLDIPDEQTVECDEQREYKIKPDVINDLLAAYPNDLKQSKAQFNFELTAMSTFEINPEIDSSSLISEQIDLVSSRSLSQRRTEEFNSYRPRAFDQESYASYSDDNKDCFRLSEVGGFSSTSNIDEKENQDNCDSKLGQTFEASNENPDLPVAIDEIDIRLRSDDELEKEQTTATLSQSGGGEYITDQMIPIQEARVCSKEMEATEVSETLAYCPAEFRASDYSKEQIDSCEKEELVWGQVDRTDGNDAIKNEIECAESTVSNESQQFDDAILQEETGDPIQEKHLIPNIIILNDRPVDESYHQSNEMNDFVTVESGRDDLGTSAHLENATKSTSFENENDDNDELCTNEKEQSQLYTGTSNNESYNDSEEKSHSRLNEETYDLSTHITTEDEKDKIESEHDDTPKETSIEDAMPILNTQSENVELEAIMVEARETPLVVNESTDSNSTAENVADSDWIVEQEVVSQLVANKEVDVNISDEIEVDKTSDENEMPGSSIEEKPEEILELIDEALSGHAGLTEPETDCDDYLHIDGREIPQQQCTETSASLIEGKDVDNKTSRTERDDKVNVPVNEALVPSGSREPVVPTGSDGPQRLENGHQVLTPHPTPEMPSTASSDLTYNELEDAVPRRKYTRGPSPSKKNIDEFKKLDAASSSKSKPLWRKVVARLQHPRSYRRSSAKHRKRLLSEDASAPTQPIVDKTSKCSSQDESNDDGWKTLDRDSLPVSSSKKRFGQNKPSGNKHEWRRFRRLRRMRSGAEMASEKLPAARRPIGARNFQALYTGPHTSYDNMDDDFMMERRSEGKTRKKRSDLLLHHHLKEVELTGEPSAFKETDEVFEVYCDQEKKEVSDLADSMANKETPPVRLLMKPLMSGMHAHASHHKDKDCSPDHQDNTDFLRARPSKRISCAIM